METRLFEGTAYNVKWKYQLSVLRYAEEDDDGRILQRQRRHEIRSRNAPADHRGNTKEVS